MKVLRKIAIIFGIVVLVVLASLWVRSITVNKSEAPQTAGSDHRYTQGTPDPQEMLELVNAERAKAGVKPLTIDENVQKSAQLKAEDMDRRNYFSHIVKGTKYTLTEEMAVYVRKSCKHSSENITDNLVDRDNTSEQSVYNWIHSPPHYKAMIDPKYTYTGFGVSGTKIVQHFCVAK